MCRDTLVCRDGIVGVSRETGVSQVCRDKMVGCDKEQKKNQMPRVPRPTAMRDVS